MEYARLWWLFGKPRSDIRPALDGLARYIATVETARHRVFQFLDGSILPDNMLVNIALEDPFSLGVLSSSVHVVWALAAGARQGVGNDPRYTKTRCFDPFPVATEAQRAEIGALAEELDAHRKRVLAAHPKLTLTGLHNVLEKLKAGAALTPKERVIHEQGQVTVMRALHERIDEAVAEAYGWPVDLEEREVLSRLVALNEERRGEEERGQVRWLRPGYQAPAGMRVDVSAQGELAVERVPSSVTAASKRPKLPKDPLERIVAVRGVLAALSEPASVDAISSRFVRARRDDVERVLASLVSLGLADRSSDDRYAS